MAKNEEIRSEEPDKKDIAKSGEDEPIIRAQDAPAQEEAVRQSKPWPLITVGVFGIVLVLAAISIAWLQLAKLSHASLTRGDDSYSMREQARDDQRERMRGHGGMRGSMTQPIAMGVVTAVDDDSVTVAGGGKQTVIKRTDNTKVSGDESEVKVNDTVVIFGTETDDDSLTATRIVVRNNMMSEDATLEDEEFEAPRRPSA